MKIIKKEARLLHLGDKLQDIGEVCALEEIRSDVVRVRYRDSYTPPDASKFLDVHATTSFHIVEKTPCDLVREAIDRLEAFQGESIYTLLRRKEPYVTAANWVFTMKAQEFLFSIGQMVVEARHTPTNETMWLGVWSDGPRSDYEVYTTRGECVDYFLVNLRQRLTDEDS